MVRLMTGFLAVLAWTMLAVLGPKLAQIYGQGESPMTITVLPKRYHVDRGDGQFERRLASVGYAQAVVQVKTIDAEGNELPPGEIGEIVSRGNLRMAGYFKDEKATLAVRENGWNHTGDVGYKDENDYIYIVDRANTGMHILELTGAARKAAGLP